MPAGRTLLSSAKWIALCTAISRVTGLLRDMLLAHAFGQSRIADAFNFGFLIPNIFRRLFGEGALTAVFVPTFTKTLESEGRPSAWQLLSRTATLLTLVLTGLTVLIELLLLALWFAPWGDAAGRALPIGLTAMMLPFMISICLLALLTALLNCLNNFIPGALASIVLNVVMIAGIVWLGPAVGGNLPEKQVFGVALSVLIAGVLQLLFIWPAVRRERVELRWDRGGPDPRVRDMISRMLPVLLGQGALMLSTYLDAQMCMLLMPPRNATNGASFLGTGLAFPLEPGALTAVSNAQRLYQFPLGVLVISLATAALPAFSRMAARGDWKPWTEQVRSLLRLAIFEGLLAGAMMLAAAEPIVRLLFEYGQFDAHATARAARVLGAYGFGMAAFCATHIMLRAFYSLDDVRTPLRISYITLPLNLAISIALVWLPSVRESAFAISSAITSLLTVALGLYFLSRKTPEPLLNVAVGRGLLGMLFVACTAGFTVYFARFLWLGYLHQLPGPSWIQRLLDTGCSLGLGGGIYLTGAAFLGMPEPGMLLSRSRRSTQSVEQN